MVDEDDEDYAAKLDIGSSFQFFQLRRSIRLNLYPAPTCSL